MGKLIKTVVKWGVIAGLSIAAVNFVWSGSMETAFRKAKARVQKHISPEFELDRIRGEISKLTPDMHRNIDKIAEETVAVASLQRKIETVSGELTNRRGEILAMTEAVESGVKKVSYSPTNLKDKLARDLRAYKNCEKDLENKQKLLAAKKESLEAARNQLQQITVQKQELEVMAAQFEAELANLREAQSRSKFRLDDSRLAQIKESFEKLRERIDVERTKAEMHGTFLNSGSLSTEKKDEATSKDIVSEVREYFGESRKSETAQ